jgi:hypothetical protein
VFAIGDRSAMSRIKFHRRVADSIADSIVDRGLKRHELAASRAG